MNGYLVMQRQERDDIPLAFFRTAKKACEFATKVKPGFPDRLADLLNTDGSPPLAVLVYQFVDGFPRKRVYWRSL